MYNYANCQRCGRKLRDAFWCRSCELTFCSMDCLKAHRTTHAAAATAHAAARNWIGPAEARQEWAAQGAK
jgi:hypothetical protein